jgi:hypothetical protein
MKNIHILLTDQPSRLWINNLLQGKLELSKETLIGSNTAQHMYVTSDEEIKEGDWFLSDFNSFPLHNIKELSERKDSLGWKQEDLKNNLKIILTTDPTLITDGVQAIDDEFLEWFVKNPTCEFVEVKKRYSEFTVDPFVGYKIIIPQEEPKTGYVKSETEFLGVEFTLKDGSKQFVPIQETLEEAAEKYSEDGGDEKSFIAGGKYVAERMYSEDEVKELIEKALTHNDHNLCGPLATAQNEIRTANFGVWFEHNKK